MDAAFLGAFVLSNYLGTTLPQPRPQPSNFHGIQARAQVATESKRLSQPSSAGHASRQQRCSSSFAFGLFAGLAAAASQRIQGRQGCDRIVVRGRNYETNIKKKKGPAERALAKITAKHLSNITKAIKAGGPDPSLNRSLARSISAAIKDRVPRATVDRRLQVMKEGKVAVDPMVFSGSGPQGAAIIVECLTDNKNRTRAEVAEAFKNASCTLGQQGCSDHCFERLGCLRFEDLDEEKVLEASMEADVEAEDIKTLENGQVEVTVLPEKYHASIDAFEAAGMEPASSEVVMRTVTEAIVSEKGTYELLHLFHELEELDDIGEVHCNAVLKEEVELQFSNYDKVIPSAKVYK
eukprot:TRINITY_DN66227_c0_g1_i1.p1 TRINITY_DN66227_c0_g1~~TRINITY_DN66227_c0_g1_i1.p1  ORF type:complete len:351 (+),score=79.46 TRINITY_DN66227_c0_g1_i1:61-1113(+)